MKYFASSFLLAACLNACTQAVPSDVWLLHFDSAQNLYSYHNQRGEIVIPPEKYEMCLTDTFRQYAMVLLEPNGFVVIDRQEKVQYNVFIFDNGPDYPSDGLFRIVQNGKIGYADAKTYSVVIPPQFDCAEPFENGKAKVSRNCQKTQDGEHVVWSSEQWLYIDKKGKETAQ